jgi:hypothetical protein
MRRGETPKPGRAAALSAALALLISAPALALTWTTDSQATFNEGTYVNTNWVTDHLEIPAGVASGTYTSKVLDAGTTMRWQSLAWVEGAPYQEPLPDNRASEGVPGGADMSSNALLLHLEEASGQLADSSGPELNTCNL